MVGLAVLVGEAAVLGAVAAVDAAGGGLVGLPVGAGLALVGLLHLAPLLVGLLGADEAAAGLAVGDGELAAQALVVGVAGVEALADAAHRRAGRGQLGYRAVLGAGAAGLGVEVLGMEPVCFLLEVAAHDVEHLARVYRLVESVAAYPGFFQGQHHILDAVVGIGGGQYLSGFYQLGGAQLIGHAHRVAKAFEHHHQQLYHRGLAEPIPELE